MKRMLTIAAFSLLMNVAFAQQSGTPEVRASKATTKMERSLSLSDDQKAKVQTILVARFNAIDAVKASGAPAEEQTRRIGQIKSENDSEIMALLTPEQVTKYKEMRNRKGSTD